MTVEEPLYLINNSPPALTNPPTNLVLNPGESYSLLLGPINDFENNNGFIESWSLSKTVNWVEFKNSTSFEDVEFSFSPPMKMKENE